MSLSQCATRADCMLQAQAGRAGFPTGLCRACHAPRIFRLPGPAARKSKSGSARSLERGRSVITAYSSVCILCAPLPIRPCKKCRDVLEDQDISLRDTDVRWGRICRLGPPHTRTELVTFARLGNLPGRCIFQKVVSC